MSLLFNRNIFLGSGLKKQGKSRNPQLASPLGLSNRFQLRSASVIVRGSHDNNPTSNPSLSSSQLKPSSDPHHGVNQHAQETSKDLDAAPTPTKGDSSSSPTPLALASVDTSAYSPQFVARRLLVFAGITLGYMGLYFTRGSLTYTAPVMVADPTLKMTLADVGAMTSAFPMAYGVSKFLGGVLGAKFSSRALLGYGLAVTAAINVAFGLIGVAGAASGGASVAALTALWALNGGIQGVGAPASASLLTRWFAGRERGTYWGLWNMGANTGGFLTPVLVGYTAKALGWQWGMWVPGAIGLILALFTLAVVRDSPEDAGYPSPEALAGGGAGGAGGGEEEQKKKAASTSIAATLSQAVRHPGTWLLAFTYFFVYVVRQGATSWLVFYLLAEKGAADAAAAAVTVSGLELGGLLGGTLSGFMSDARIRAAGNKPDVGHVGQLVQIVMAYLVATVGVLAAIKAVPANIKWLQWVAIAGLGFCIYGPQMLIGLCGAELVEKSSVGASQGILGLVSYMGAANAGVPLSWVVQNHGWNGYFTAMTVACAVAFLLLTPLANSKSYVQKQRELAAKTA